VPADARSPDSLRGALAASGHDASLPTLWLAERLLEDCTAQDLLAALHTLHECSGPGSCLLASFTDPLARGIHEGAGVPLPAALLLRPAEEVVDLVAAAGWRCEVQLAAQLAQSYGIDLAGVLHVVRAVKPAA
jgi:O-methyltransferase involved in polyketide biosynthesis